jgi:hypothetical protein
VRRSLTLLVCSLMVGCPSSPTGRDAGRDAEGASDGGSDRDGGSVADGGPADVGFVARDAGPQDQCPEGLAGQPSICLTIGGAASSPLPPNFSGLLTQDYRSGWQPWDPRYVEFAKRAVPGFIAVGAVYSWDWHSGSIPMSNVEVHARKAGKYNQTLDFHKVIRGKGYLKLDDYARAAAQLDAKLVIEANVRTSDRYAADQVASIRAYAEHVAGRGYPVLYWKLSSEPVYWSDDKWCDMEHRPCAPFHAGGDGYAADMKPFFDAIAAGYAAAGVDVPPRVLHHTEGGHTGRQRRFDGVQLNPETHQLEPWVNAGGIAYYGSIADRVTHPERQKYWDDWGHNWFTGQKKYSPDEADPITCDSDPAGHWAHFKKHLNDVLENRAVQTVDEYHLRVNGADGFDTPPPASLRGNIGSFSARATTPYTTTMFAAIYAAESVMRWSTHSRLRSVGYFALTSNCMGMSGLGRLEARQAGNIPASAAVTDSVADSVAVDYGEFAHLPCLALGLTNRAINLGVERLAHGQAGGVSTVATAVEEKTGPARWVPGPEHQVPATYSASYLGADGVVRVVVTNRSDTAHAIDLIHDGRRLTGSDMIAGEVLSAAAGDFRNYGATTPAVSPNCVPDRPVGHLDQDLVALDLNQPLSAAPWSVTLIEYRSPNSGELPPPASLQVNAGIGRFEATWAATPGATGYRVLWGVQPGLYTSRAERAGTSFGIDYLDGIPVYFAVSALGPNGYGAPSAEVSGQTLPELLASDDFEATGLGEQWISGCGDASSWGHAQGRLVAADSGATRHCALSSASASADQKVSASLSHAGWPTPLGNAQFGLIGRYQDPQTYVVGALRPTMVNGAPFRRAVIEVHHPSLPNGLLEVGTSPVLSLMEAEGWFPSALTNGQGDPATLELELSGRTLRLFVGRGGQRRMLAAGLDSFVQPETGPMVQAPLELETQLTAAGQAGVMSEAIAVAFDDFSVR